MEPKTRRKYWIIGGIATVAVLMAVLVAVIINAKYSATLDILVAPSMAKVKVNGKEYKNGTYRMEPGELTAEIVMEGFESKTIPVNLVAGNTTKLYTYLLPADGSYEWYLEHPEEQMLLNTIGDARAAEEGRVYAAANPIVEVLPIVVAKYDEKWNYTEYRVDGGDFDECEKEFCLRITDTTGGNYEAALASIREKGFKPEDYEIIYQYKPIVPLD